MPRHTYKKIEVKEDLIYHDIRVTKLINYVMRDGKKSIAEKIVYSTLENIKNQTKKDPLLILGKAISNVAPKFEVRPRRLGGASYLVPREVRESRKLFLALNWIIKAAETRSNKEHKTFISKLTAEIIAASQGEGEAVNKRAQTEKLAEANKAFAHLRW